MPLIAIGGLRLASWRAGPEFFLRASLSLRQAGRAPGCLFAAAQEVDDIHFSLTAWVSEAAMADFARSGHHLKAMGAQRKLGENLGFHRFEGPAPPDWDDALARWRAAKG